MKKDLSMNIIQTVSNTPLTGPLKTICHELDLPKLLGFSPDFLEVRSGDLSADFKVRS